MYEPKVFISYSRRNSEFAEQLTRELIGKGADVSFDQLSIEAGSAWDSSIDQAIDEADTIVLLLSKSSVASENVLDEIAFALEENKTIVPVLLEPCKVPFRINQLTKYDLSLEEEKKIADHNKLGLNVEKGVVYQIFNVF